METNPLTTVGVIIAIISLISASVAHLRIKSKCCNSSCSIDPLSRAEEGRPQHTTEEEPSA